MSHSGREPLWPTARRRRVRDQLQEEPLQEEPFQLDPFQLEPLHEEPLHDEPLQLDPFHDEPAQVVGRLTVLPTGVATVGEVWVNCSPGWFTAA